MVPGDLDSSEGEEIDGSDDEENSDEGFDEEDRYDCALYYSAQDTLLLTLT